MDKTKLELYFLDEANKKFRLSINDPRASITKEEIGTAMAGLIEHNIFTSNGMDIIKLEVAKVVTTSTEEMAF